MASLSARCLVNRELFCRRCGKNHRRLAKLWFPGDARIQNFINLYNMIPNAEMHYIYSVQVQIIVEYNILLYKISCKCYTYYTKIYNIVYSKSDLCNHLSRLVFEFVYCFDSFTFDNFTSFLHYMLHLKTFKYTNLRIDVSNLWFRNYNMHS